MTRPRLIAALTIFALVSPGRAADLETLWADYQAFGLPAPPADAQLAVLPSRTTHYGDGGRQQDQHLVLLIRPAQGNDRAVYWLGCDRGPTWGRMELRPV